jgi:hypothetical protein
LSNMQQADNMTYDDMKEVTEGFVCRACEPQCTPNRPGVFTPINLSMSELHVTDNERVHWIDYITEHTEAYDLPALQVAYKKALEGATWSTQLHELPAPFGFKEDVGVEARIQICIFPTAKNAFIVKHCIFKSKLKPAIFKKVAYGKPHSMNYVHPKIGPKVWQYTFQGIGGYLFLCYELSAEAKAKSDKGPVTNLSDKTDEEIDGGFAFIEKHAKGLSGVKLLLWQTKALKNQTPIRNWPIKLAKEIIRLIVTEGTLIKEEYNWPLTMVHFQDWVLKIMEDLYEFDTVAFGLLGASGKGKSPLGRTALLSQCRANKRTAAEALYSEPCLRVTTDFDFLRSRPGNIVTGYKQ